MKKRSGLLTVKTKLQSQLLRVVFVTFAVPTFLFGGSLYYMISRISASHTALSMHEIVLDLTPFIAVLFSILTSLLLCWVFFITNQIVGPIDRMIRELDERIQGKKSGPIVLRPGDRLIPLVDKINLILQQCGKSSSS